MKACIAVLALVACANAGFLGSSLYYPSYYTGYYPAASYAYNYRYHTPTYYTYARPVTHVVKEVHTAPVVSTVVKAVEAAPVVKAVQTVPVVAAPVVKAVAPAVIAAPIATAYSYPTYGYNFGYAPYYGNYLLKK